MGGAFGSAVMGALGTVGLWFGAAAGTAAGAVVNVAATIGTAGVAAIVGGIVSVCSYLYPRVGKMIRDFRRSDVIARCKFEADGTPYEAMFSLSRNRWELRYGDNRWIRSGVNVEKGDIAAFFQTDFFKRFNGGCFEIMSRVYGG